MINSGTCPHCSSRISAVQIEHIDITENMRTKFHGISYLCPSCKKVLSVGIDPIAVKTDILEEIKREIQKWSR